ncbi:MAG: hypothetical protein IIT46_02645, partial [Lachnospiraceae bacterium]|nr:hypothetical protein [Lachnospiraceae bacterium]
VINQLIVFSLSGLWHGASITFVMWGLFNGIMVILSGLFENRSSESQGKSFLNFIRMNNYRQYISNQLHYSAPRTVTHNNQKVV